MKRASIFFFFVLILSSANAQKKQLFGTADYVRALKHATDIMVNDVTSPVAASRYYAYINLVANETISQFRSSQPKFGDVLNGYKPIVVAASSVQQGDAELGAVLSVYEAGARLLPSGYLLKKNIDSLLVVAKKKGLDTTKINATVSAVKTVLQGIADYAYTDGFTTLSGLRRFTPATGDEYWQPTAPGFMSALEPYWYTLRPFILDSAAQFTVGGPNTYDTLSTSAFYREMREVYETGKSLNREQTEIASYWDCNPYALQQMGHLEFGIKKISPGGHWMGITGIACRKKKLDVYSTAYIHALVSVGIADGFISCWKTKYRHNRVRPETAIKKLIDRNWQPLLQTPPFPEYTSGHSVISTVAATILTDIFSPQFSFIDDTEVEFGLSKRKFSSFSQAAQEAAISRLYGGIHFRDAIENGQKEGQMIGQYVIQRISKLPNRITFSGNAIKREKQ